MMTEQMKKHVIQKVLLGDCAFGIGQKNGERILSITVVVPHKAKNLCVNHQLPAIYLNGGRIVCERCLDAEDDAKLAQYLVA